MDVMAFISKMNAVLDNIAKISDSSVQTKLGLTFPYPCKQSHSLITTVQFANKCFIFLIIIRTPISVCVDASKSNCRKT